MMAYLAVPLAAVPLAAAAAAAAAAVVVLLIQMDLMAIITHVVIPVGMYIRYDVSSLKIWNYHHEITMMMMIVVIGNEVKMA